MKPLTIDRQVRSQPVQVLESGQRTIDGGHAYAIKYTDAVNPIVDGVSFSVATYIADLHNESLNVKESG